MKTSAFGFELPPECIAQAPVTPRDAARMLRVDEDGVFADLAVRDVPSLLRPGDAVVFNDTRVIPARLFATRDEARIEFLLLEQCGGVACWKVFAKPAKRLKPGDICRFSGDFSAEILEKRDDGTVLLRFDAPENSVMHHIEALGHMPLPPYIRGGKAELADSERYQTVYAVHKGSVAAPTAGLHFTPELLQAIDACGAMRCHVTLHVGAGTFQPVKAEDTRDHVMHSERALLDVQTAEKLNAVKAAGGRIIAVGTTSLRTLESAAREDGTLQAFAGNTSIFITPGYHFRAVDVLMTNFHLPRSTLFMLVSAFSGMETMHAAYAHAIGAGYRFYSYGDACWLERGGP